jgi:hypothetical protein
MTSSAVSIQTSLQSVPSVPVWFGEVALLAHHLKQESLLKSLVEHVRLSRARFGHSELIDVVVVLMGSALSGEATLETFYNRLQPFATPFMALLGRSRLPHRWTLSRFLAAPDQAPVDARQTLF